MQLDIKRFMAFNSVTTFILHLGNDIHSAARYLTKENYVWLHAQSIDKHDMEIILKVTFALPIWLQTQYSSGYVHIFSRENVRNNIKCFEKLEEAEDPSDLAAFWELGACRGRSWGSFGFCLIGWKCGTNKWRN